jgi:hypothetical protein
MVGIDFLHYKKEKAMKTRSIETHPNFKIVGKNLKEGYAVFDISVVTLTFFRIFCPRARPICLPHSDKSFDLKEGIVTGW